MSIHTHRAPGALTTSLAALAALSAVTAATACPSCPASFEDMLTESELVFRGTVTDITYRNAEVDGANEAHIPYTFVTYQVSEVFLGSLDTDTITLRFIGGWEPVTAGFLHTSGAPLFDKGDHDILFVTGNTDRGLPLAGGSNGRLRLIDGNVFDETGRAVLLHGEDSFRFGPRHFHPDVFTTQVGDGIMTITMDTDEEGLQFGPSTGISERKAIRHLHRITASLPNPETLFVNADPAQPIFAPDFTAVAPPADPLEGGDSTVRDAGSLAEDEASAAKTRGVKPNGN